MKRKIIHVIILFISMTVFSQNNEIGVFIGGSNYIGDVGPTTYIHPFSYNLSTNAVAGIIFRKNLNERIALRAKLNYSKIGSSDNWPNTVEYRNKRGRYFKNVLTEFGVGIDFNFIEFDIYNSSLQMTPYISTGINFFNYNALRYEIGELKADQYGKGSNISVPITIGYKLKPLRNFIIGFEITANTSFTDNLDGSYPIDKYLVSSEIFGSTLSKDWYVFSGITLTYLFGNKKCYCPN
ncbi:DUF6089 family protein [Flavobacteriaceae bacterium]|jgi:hypothetical protein|nr:DUF6089 family protein [Flavobacteriaceae bacterium]